MAKIGTNASVATQVLGAIPWVRCASGNVLFFSARQKDIKKHSCPWSPCNRVPIFFWHSRFKIKKNLALSKRQPMIQDWSIGLHNKLMQTTVDLWGRSCFLLQLALSSLYSYPSHTPLSPLWIVTTEWLETQCPDLTRSPATNCIHYICIQKRVWQIYPNILLTNIFGHSFVSIFLLWIYSDIRSSVCYSVNTRRIFEYS